MRRLFEGGAYSSKYGTVKWLKDCPKNEQLAEKRNFKGNCAILRIVFQPRALSYELPASRKGVYCFVILRIIYRTHVDRSCIFLYGFLSRYVENCQPVFYLSLTGFCKKFFAVFLDPFSLNVRLFLVLVMGIHEYYCHCFFWDKKQRR